MTIYYLDSCNLIDTNRLQPNIQITKDSILSILIKGRELKRNGEYYKARETVKKIIDPAIKLLGEKDTTVLRAYHNIGTYFALDSELDSAIIYLNKVEKLQPRPIVEWIQSHNDCRLGFVFLQLEEFEIALNYYKQGQLRARNSPKSEMNFAESAFYQSVCLRAIKNNSTAIIVIDTALNYLNSKKVLSFQDSVYLGELLTQKALILKENKFFDASILEFKKSMLFQKDSKSNLLETLTDIADVELLQNNSVQAQKIISKIEREYSKLLSQERDFNSSTPYFYKTKADIEKAIKNYPLALKNYNLALNALQYSRDSAENNTTGFKTRDNTDSDLYLEIQNTKADVYKTLYANSGNVLYAATANAVYDTLSFNAKRIRLRYLSENAKIALSTKLKPIYQSAMSFNLRLFENTKDSSYLRRAFDFCEQTKAMSVFESVQINNLKLNAETAALKSERDKARISRTELEKQLANNKLSDAESKNLNNKCLALRNTEKLLTTQINNAISDDIEKNKFSISDIQHKILGKNQALVEYALSDSLQVGTSSLLTTFVISPEKISYRQIAINSNFLHDVETQIATFNDENKWNSPEFAQRANGLYNILFKPTENILPERLIIISEPQFDLLPFETLLSDTARSFQAGIKKSVLYRYSLSFAYSAQLLGMQWAIPVRTATNITAFAPIFPKDGLKPSAQLISPSLQKTLPSLRYINNEREIDSIKHGVVPLIREKATKNNFITAFNGEAIVHASTHGILNNARSNLNFIAFSQNSDTLNKEELLFVDDLYSQPLPTPLFVLTACETSGGSITSEGNISIARGLAYSGVKSYVTTLLPARATFNAELFKRFYENILDKHLDKDVALNQAKREFITYFGNYDPAIWSGFILVGDDRPIAFRSTPKINLALIGLGILLLISSIGIYLSGRKRNRVKK